MTSNRQRSANRANARASTGPKTSGGKATVRLNAMQHGLLCRDVVLPGEDAEAFEDLRNRVWADLAPAGPLEELLTDRVVNAMWRLRRLERAECALFHWRVHMHKAERLAAKVASYVEVTGGLLSLSFGAERTITDEASYARVARELRRAEFERDRDELSLGRAFDADAKDGEAFGKLNRYETGIERSLFRSLQELRQIQSKRQAGSGSVAGPVAATERNVNGERGELALFRKNDAAPLHQATGDGP